MARYTMASYSPGRKGPGTSSWERAGPVARPAALFPAPPSKVPSSLTYWVGLNFTNPLYILSLGPPKTQQPPEGDKQVEGHEAGLTPPRIQPLRGLPSRGLVPSKLSIKTTQTGVLELREFENKHSVQMSYLLASNWLSETRTGKLQEQNWQITRKKIKGFSLPSSNLQGWRGSRQPSGPENM